MRSKGNRGQPLLPLWNGRVPSPAPHFRRGLSPPFVERCGTGARHHAARRVAARRLARGATGPTVVRSAFARGAPDRDRRQPRCRRGCARLGRGPFGADLRDNAYRRPVGPARRVERSAARRAPADRTGFASAHRRTRRAIESAPTPITGTETKKATSAERCGRVSSSSSQLLEQVASRFRTRGSARNQLEQPVDREPRSRRRPARKQRQCPGSEPE